MTTATSLKPAKTRRYPVHFLGPKGGSHHESFTFKLNQQVDFESQLKSPRAEAIFAKMKADGWLIRIVRWYRTGAPRSMGPHAILVYRLHKNDVYNSRLVKPGWRIVG